MESVITLMDLTISAPDHTAVSRRAVTLPVIRPAAVPTGEPGSPTQRDRHLEVITERGRLAWQAATNDGQRSLVETTMGRYKALIGPRLRAIGFAAQQTEAAIP